MHTHRPSPRRLSNWMKLAARPHGPVVKRARPRVEILEDRTTPSTLEIVSLGTTNATIFDHDSLTGDDEGGMAISDTHVFYTGDNGTAAFPLDLSSGVSIGSHLDGLVSDFGSQTAYVLGTSATSPVPNDLQSATITHLLELDSTTGALTGNSVALSTPVNLDDNSHEPGIFSGVDQIFLYDGNTGNVYGVDTGSGNVTTLGNVGTSFQFRSSESWAFWGVAEEFGGDLYITYVQDQNNIVRRNIADGTTTVVANFPNGLGDTASFTLSLDLQRWYFHYESSNGTFGGSSETIGFADAVIKTFPGDFTPVDPDPRTEPVDFVDITFDDPITASTFDYRDLQLTRNNGVNLITSAVTVTDQGGNTFRIGNLTGITGQEGSYRLTIVGSGIDDAGATPLEGQATERWLNDAQFPALQRKNPAGSLIYDPSINRGLPNAGDVQDIEIDLDAGQRFSVLVEPTAGLEANVVVANPGGLELSDTTGAADQTILVNHLQAATAGTYTISVRGANGTTGRFTLSVILNADLEFEEHGGASNDTLGTAQNIDASFISLTGSGSAQRGAVIGNVQAPVLVYGSNQDEQFLLVDVGTGATSLIADNAGSGRGFTDLAYNPVTDILYGSGAQGDTGLYTIDVITGQGTLLGNPGTLHSLAWSPDGSTLYAVTSSSQFGTVDAGSGAFTFIANTPARVHGMAFQPGSGTLFAVTQDQELHTVDPGTGAFTFLDAQAEFYQSLEFMPDGTLLGGSSDNNLYEIDPATGNETVIGPTNFDTLVGLEAVPAAANNVIDIYSFTLAANQTATLAVHGAGTVLELLDGGNNVLETGVASANVHQVISNYTAPAAGLYYARLTRPTSRGDYNLVVTRDAAFDTESNNSFAGAQDLAGQSTALGFADGTGDYYRFHANAGDSISWATNTPSDGPFEFANSLNPGLELYAPNGDLLAVNDNGAADGRNALLSHIAPVTGDYVIRVLAVENTEGEYVLRQGELAPGVHFVADPCHPGAMVIYVQGTAGKDVILVGPASGNRVKVTFNGAASFFQRIDVFRVLIFGQEGADEIRFARRYQLDAFIDGGMGNDVIQSGGGHDILLGGAGHDVLAGDEGRDVIIGGDDTDRHKGGSGDDLLIGGRTIYDEDHEALCAISAKWKSGASYNTRVTHLRNGTGAPRLSDAEIIDAVFDHFTSDGGLQLFFASAADTITGKKASEKVVTVS